jgi:hypothetical protein
MSRQLVRYIENTRIATPVNMRPGCQNKHESIDATPAQKGLFLEINNNDSNPNRIIEIFGSVPVAPQE